MTLPEDPFAQAVIVALIGIGATWVAIFVVRFIRAPAQLYYAQMDRIDTLQSAIRAGKTKEEKQAVIDELASELNWATINLLNRPNGWSTNAAATQLANDILIWMQKIETRLGDRAFFTLAQQHHFGTSGFIEPIKMSGHGVLDHQFSILRNKFERLRDIIKQLEAKL